MAGGLVGLDSFNTLNAKSLDQATAVVNSTAAAITIALLALTVSVVLVKAQMWSRANRPVMPTIKRAANSVSTKWHATANARQTTITNADVAVESNLALLDVVGSGLELFLANPVFSLLYYLGSLLFFGSLALGKGMSTVG
jgi:hypothetical protein